MMLTRDQIKTASDLIEQVRKWREERNIASEALNLKVEFFAPETALQFQHGMTRSGVARMEPGRINAIRDSVVEQLDAQIAAGERELAKLGVTAD